MATESRQHEAASVWRPTCRFIGGTFIRAGLVYRNALTAFLADDYRRQFWLRLSPSSMPTEPGNSAENCPSGDAQAPQSNILKILNRDMSDGRDPSVEESQLKLDATLSRRPLLRRAGAV
jgi:hypothetical protein